MFKHLKVTSACLTVIRKAILFTAIFLMSQKEISWYLTLLLNPSLSTELGLNFHLTPKSWLPLPFPILTEAVATIEVLPVQFNSPWLVHQQQTYKGCIGEKKAPRVSLHFLVRRYWKIISKVLALAWEANLTSGHEEKT